MWAGQAFVLGTLSVVRADVRLTARTIGANRTKRTRGLHPEQGAGAFGCEAAPHIPGCMPYWVN